MQSQFIEVGIGLIFVFLLMAIMVSASNEVLMSVFRSGRGPFLKKAISAAIDDPLNKDWSKLLYDHPMIDMLKKSEKRPPAYITSETFAIALIDVITNEGKKYKFEVNGDTTTWTEVKTKATQFKKFTLGLETMNESNVKKMLQTFANNANGDYNELKAQIEKWYEEYMERVGGWYKKKAKKWIFIQSALLTILLNVNTIELSKQLWNNAVLRESVVNAAEGYVEANGAEFTKQHELNEAEKALIRKLETDTTLDQMMAIKMLDSIAKAKEKKEYNLNEQIAKIKSTYKQFDMLNLPIGWHKQNSEVAKLKKEHFQVMTSIDNGDYNWAQRFWFKNCERISYYLSVVWIYLSSIAFFGWLFTAIAVSFGAPFWFDLLNKFVNLRGTGKAAKKVITQLPAKSPETENT